MKVLPTAFIYSRSGFVERILAKKHFHTKYCARKTLMKLTADGRTNATNS